MYIVTRILQFIVLMHLKKKSQHCAENFILRMMMSSNDINFYFDIICRNENDTKMLACLSIGINKNLGYNKLRDEAYTNVYL